MTNRERFRAALNFQALDRLPVIEWAPWWDKTIQRWHGEGLPAELTDAFEIRRHLGLDAVRQWWLPSAGPGLPRPRSHGAGIIADEADYERVLPHLYPENAFDPAALRPFAQQQRRGELVTWITLNGFFWFPRGLLGIQNHLYAFYDQPALMHRINADLAAHHRKVLGRLLDVLVPDFMTFAEDMSYNHGPMISRRQFDEFIAPYYRQVAPLLHQAGTRVLVDSDGDITELIDWMLGVGVEGFLPLERMAGVDVAEFRRRWPRLLMIGAFDKTVMHRGEQVVRAEFERLLPVMRGGGFVPGVDHQTPPEVSLEQYRQYVTLLKEYCRKSAK